MCQMMEEIMMEEIMMEEILISIAVRRTRIKPPFDQA
jgi:hypothetical protein